MKIKNIGIGNPILSDDSLGVKVARALNGKLSKQNGVKGDLA